MMRARTNFSRYNHDRLYQMLHDGDESTPRSAAHSWDGVGARLHEQAGNLERKLAAFRQQWQGGAAEQYQLMITDLGAGLRRIGDAVFAMRDTAHDAADSLTKAKTQMPPPVAVPAVSPTTVYLATTPVEVDPLASTQDVATLRRKQADAATELAGYQQAVQASDSAHAKAVAVMTALATEYTVASDGMPVTPKAAGTRPVPTEDATGWESLTKEPESEVDVDGVGAPPVFGTMFTAGVAAAAAATAGRLGMRLTPKVPLWAQKDKDKAEQDKAKVDAAAGKASAGLGGGKLGGFGGGGGGFGGTPSVPSAAPGMLGGAGAGQAAAALRAAAGAAGAGAGAMPFMPMMPFAPMGAGGANARRVPPWLTETEDVWGESVVITPPVLGEDPPQERRRPTDFSF